jgi:hypothetical protein
MEKDNVLSLSMSVAVARQRRYDGSPAGNFPEDWKGIHRTREAGPVGPVSGEEGPDTGPKGSGTEPRR